MRQRPKDNMIRNWSAMGDGFVTSRLGLQRAIARQIEDNVLDAFNETMCGYVIDWTNKKIYRARLNYKIEVEEVEPDVQEELKDQFFPPEG